MAETKPSAPAGLSKEEAMASAPLGKLIFKLSIPVVLAQLINVLYNIVDRIYIGNIPEIGATALTGVGVTAPILMLVSAFAAFAGMGGAPLASIQLGAGNRKEAQRILGSSLAMLLALSVVLTVVFQIYKRPLLYMFGASDALIGYGLDYITIYLWGTVFVLLALGLNTFVTAQGRSDIAMVSVLVGAVTNIVLDPIFIFALGMGVKGAALATVISQALSAIWVIVFLIGPKSSLQLKWEYIRLEKKMILKITALGCAPFIMQSTESFVSITLNSGLQRYGGDLYVGTMTIIQSVMMMVTMPVQGLIQGTQPIISYNYGAKNHARVRSVFFLLLKICLIVSICSCLLVVLGAPLLARIFTSDTALINLTAQVMPIFFAGIWAFGAQMACQAAFMGTGQAKSSLFVALLRKIILLIPLAIILPMAFGNVLGIYWAEPIADIVASCTTLILFLSQYKKLLPVHPSEK